MDKIELARAYQPITGGKVKASQYLLPLRQKLLQLWHRGTICSVSQPTAAFQPELHSFRYFWKCLVFSNPFLDFYSTILICFCWQLLTLSWEQPVQQENIRENTWASTNFIQRMKVKGGSTSRDMMKRISTTCTGETFLDKEKDKSNNKGELA